MTRRPRLLFVVGLSAVGVVTTLAIVAFAGLGDEVKTAGQAVPGRAAVTVKTDVTPRTHLFGDTLVARLDVVVDRDAVAPGLPRVVRSFAPYVVDGVTTVRRDVGQFSQLRYTFRLRCLRANCLPPSGRANVRFEPVRVLYRSPAGEAGRRARLLAAGRALLAARLRSRTRNRSRARVASTLPSGCAMAGRPHRASARVAPLVADAVIAVLLLAAACSCYPHVSSSTLRCPGGSRRPGNRGSRSCRRSSVRLRSSNAHGLRATRRRADVRSSGSGWSFERARRGPRARSSRARLDGDAADVRGDPAPRAAHSTRRRGWASSCRVDASFGRCPRFRRPTSARSRRTRAAPAACAPRSRRYCSASSSPAVLLARGSDDTPSRLLPPGTSGIVVIDVSRSVDGQTYQPIASVLRQLIALREPVGVVAFSDVAYQLLPPGSPSRELRSLLRLFTPEQSGVEEARGAPPSQPVRGSPPGST